MEISQIGSQILKFRKAAKLTQEELSKAVGVSTQAVSRWECGGAPDTALLPVIADTLGVTIDALFGRDSSSVQNMEDAIAFLGKYIHDDDVLNKTAEISWNLAIQCILRSYGMDVIPPKLESCESQIVSGAEKLFTSSAIQVDDGFVLGSYAKDMLYVSVYPEPEKGYVEFFASNDKYRELFKVLAEPNALEILLELGSNAGNERHFVAGAVAKRLSISNKEAERILEELRKVNILESAELEMEDKVVNTYCFQKTLYLIPILYSAKCLVQDLIQYVGVNNRKKPIFYKKRKQVNHEKIKNQ